jgi:hypothetical protein
MLTNDTPRDEQEILEQIQLLRQERELIAKLSEIRAKRQSEKQPVRAPKANQASQLSIPAFGVKKDTNSWDAYSLIVVDKLKKSKSSDVKDYMRKANPEIPEEAIDRSVNNSLWNLKKKGRVSTLQEGSRKDGYIFFLTDEQKKAAGL